MNATVHSRWPAAPPAAPVAAQALSVVVAVHDEADNIVPLVEEIHTALADLAELDLVYVDDGSADATPARLAAAQQRFPRLTVLRHRERRGQSAALVTGVRAARHAWVATLDGDRQNDPADIPRLLAALQAMPAPGLAIGWRVDRQDSRLRRWASRVANGVRGRLLGDRTPDTGCGLKVFPREAFLRLPQFDHMHRFLPALFLRAGLGVVSLPVHHRARAAGRSKYGIADRLGVGIVDLFGVLWLARRPVHAELET